MSKRTRTQAVFERSVDIFMAFACAISLLAAAGWLFNQPILLSMIRLSIQNDQVTNCEYALQIEGKETCFSASASRLSETTASMVAYDITKRKPMEFGGDIQSITDRRADRVVQPAGFHLFM